MLSRVGNASAINPGQPMKKLAQPVPHTGGAPGNPRLQLARRLRRSFLFCCAGLFACALYVRLLEIRNLT